MSTKEKLEQLKQKRAKALLGGGQDKIDKIKEQMNEVANAGLALWAKRGK